MLCGFPGGPNNCGFGSVGGMGDKFSAEKVLWVAWSTIPCDLGSMIGLGIQVTVDWPICVAWESKSL